MTDQPRKNIPLKKVVLYKHGMGYFERRGKIEGTASLEILCGAAEIDDMLKSLMVLTADGARVNAITYDSAKTLSDRMAEFGFDIRSANGLVDIIAQMKGLPVTVAASGTSTSGRVVGLDHLDHIVGDQKTREPFLVLLTGATFRRISLTSISAIDVDDSGFSAELNQQLELLFQNAKKKDKKALTVTLPETQAEIVVAYSIPSPIWKTSYRLVVMKDKLLMQGMAIVDNVQDEDWQDVYMVLVSAAPISFIQPLYEPVQPERERIAAQGYNSAGPVVAERSQSRKDAQVISGAGGPMMASVRRQRAMQDSWGAPVPAAAPGFAANSLDEAAMSASFDSPSGWGEMLSAEIDQSALPVDASSSGELFEYRIQNPVTVPRNTSALIPIVQQQVDGERISLYNERKNAKHPYCAIKLKNTSGLTLESGPVTVVEEDAYAGEALLDCLKPDDVRFLPYALDRDCHVIIRDEFTEEPVWRVRLAANTFFMDYKMRSAKIYRIENLSDREKTIFVEHPLNPQKKIVGEAKPIESTQSFHRFQLKLEPHQLQELSVIEEQDVSRNVWLGNPDHIDAHSLKWLVEQNTLDRETGAFLKAVLEKQGEIMRLHQTMANIQQRLARYQEDQSRARENLKSLGNTNERYRRAVDDAEDKIIAASNELNSLQERVQSLHIEFLEFVHREIETTIGHETRR